jgi:DNA polymerase I
VTPIDLLTLYDEIWLHDFEFVARPGEHPDVVCLVAHELRSGQTLRLWHDELGEQPPYRTDAGVLFVNFSANAECACHLALGWPLPKNVLDLSPLFRNRVNGRHSPEGKGLIGALRYYGFSSIGQKKKDAMRDRIMRGWPFAPEERKEILDYCFEDTDALRFLLPRMLEEMSENDLKVALYHGEFAATAALMEHHGVPIDMEIFSMLADQKIWRAVRDAMVPTLDARYGVYVRNNAGDWTFNMQRFVAMLAREGIAGWPTLESGQLNMKDEIFREMAKAYTVLENLHQLRHTRNKMRKVKLAVGADGRNRTVLWSFKAKTSRTQPKAAQWIFSPAVWLRFLIKPELGMALAYIDYSSAEFMIGASMSDGHCGPVNNMMDLYRSGDPYLNFAKRIDAIPKDGTKQTHGEVRDKYKTFLLASQYGMSSKTLSTRLGNSDLEALEMINQHHEVFAQYWQWSDDWVQHSLQTGMMRSAMSWTCAVGITETKERSIRNWPIQTACADMLRIACIMAARHRIRVLAPVHDAVLIEAPIERIEADVKLMQEIMRRASRIVLNSTADGDHELRTDANIIRYPDRYTDKRGKGMWDEVMDKLAAYMKRCECEVA